MDVRERIAYTRGWLEGSGAFQNDPSARTLWESLLSVCDDLADRVERLSASQGEVEEYIEAIDADLGELEDDYYGTFEDDEDDAEEAFTEDDLVRAECPRCGEEAFFEEAFLYDEGVEISCPECGEILYRSGEHTFEYEENNSAGDGEVPLGVVDE